jgi:N utilization substance protein B
MINRRLIRIKVFQALFGEFGQEDTRPSTIINNVIKSIEGIESNLLSVLSFGPEFSHFIRSEHDPSEFKYNPTTDDIKTFKLITSNKFILDIENNQDLIDYRQRPTFDWQQEKEIMFLIYKHLKSTDTFKISMVKPLDNENYFEFAKYIYKFLLLESVEFEQLMEDKNIFWYDEKIPILKSLERVFKSYDETNAVVLPELSRNASEDFEMAEELVSNYFEHRTEIEDSINSYTPGWDSERITKVDYVLMTMALCEFKYMPMIPVKVTLNEYIEIAKMYSTPKSSKFLNGTLDKILQDWTEQKLINKKGRGLIG